MRLALTAGGTGGHIIPALAVWDAVRVAAPDTEVRFFGPEDRGERAPVERAGLTFEPVPAAAVRGRGPVALTRSALRLARGIFVAARKFRSFHPDVVFSTGGYASFPGCVAARLLRRPLVVYLPDVAPGWAVKAETRLATRMATTTEAALAFLPPRKTTVTGYPVRPDFAAKSRAAARLALELPTDAPVVLIAGASQGSKALNAKVFDALPDLVSLGIIFHITGEADFPRASGLQQALGPENSGRYHPAPYRDDLPTVMLAADVAVMRAGASTLGELPAASLPAILVPGAYAGGHQRDNARWLESLGAAVILDESRLDLLLPTIRGLVDDPARLERMRAAAMALARPSAAHDIATIILEAARR